MTRRCSSEVEDGVSLARQAPFGSFWGFKKNEESKDIEYKV